MKADHGPADLIRSNVEHFRSNARSLRQEAQEIFDKKMTAAREAEVKAEEWQRALDVLKEGGVA